MTVGGEFTGGESSWWRGDHKPSLGLGVFVFDTTLRVASDVFEGFRQVSGQLTPKTIRPGRLAPKSTNLTMFLLFVFYRGFLRAIQYYHMFLFFTSYKR